MVKPMARLAWDEPLIHEVEMREPPVIAVLDDDASVREALQRFLKTFGFQVETFASGREFLCSSRLALVECVILDLAMPGMSGVEVQQQLAARSRAIPIVFITAHRDDQLGQRAIAVGVLAVLRKPVDQAELLRSVRKAFGEE
jgi:FixJ family two-component response regulator